MPCADTTSESMQRGPVPRARPLGLTALALSSAVLTACTSLVDDGTVHIAPQPEQLDLHCANWARVNRGPFRVENNTWGKGPTQGWRQCVGLGLGPHQAAVAHFTWDWPPSGPGIKAYPAVVYGKKPTATATTRALPQPIHALSALDVDYAVRATHEGSGNIAFDLWLTHTQTAATYSSPPITHELMVWLSSWGGMVPAGERLETTEIGGVVYDVHVAHKHSGGWTYIAYKPQSPQLGQQTLHMGAFLRHAQSQGYLTGKEYLASVELGSELETGRGELWIDHFEVRVLHE